MGRYLRPLGVVFADAAGLVPGGTALDVGCGPGALTAVLGGTSAALVTVLVSRRLPEARTFTVDGAEETERAGTGR